MSTDGKMPLWTAPNLTAEEREAQVWAARHAAGEPDSRAIITAAIRAAIRAAERDAVAREREAVIRVLEFERGIAVHHRNTDTELALCGIINVLQRGAHEGKSDA